jgi:hypothetical protein
MQHEFGEEDLKNMYVILSRTSEGNRSLGRQRLMWIDNMDLVEIGRIGVD